MDFLNNIIDTYNIPLLTVFLLGIITSISPCPLATNITAIAYISKQIQSVKKTIIHSIVYALGRIFSYSFIILLIQYGFSSFNISKIFQGYGDKILGPVLIFIGFLMLNIIKLPNIKGSDKMIIFKESLRSKGYIGTFLLGALFAIAFCPYSGVIFFGILIPLVLKSSYPLGLSLLYGLGTALPVMIFSLILIVSLKMLSKVFNIVGKLEKYFRYFIAVVFVLAGIYYSFITLKWILAIL